MFPVNVRSRNIITRVLWRETSRIPNFRYSCILNQIYRLDKRVSLSFHGTIKRSAKLNMRRQQNRISEFFGVSVTSKYIGSPQETVHHGCYDVIEHLL